MSRLKPRPPSAIPSPESRVPNPESRISSPEPRVTAYFTASILCFTVWVKFPEGGWITLLITGTFIALCFLVRRHYRTAQNALRRLDELLALAQAR